MSKASAIKSRTAGLPLILLLVLSLLTTACSGGADAVPAEKSPSGPRALTSEEANRLAISRFNLYRAKAVAVTSTIATGDDVLTLDGWIDTVGHRGYGLVRPRRSAGFLSAWNKVEVSAQSYAGQSAPLPLPTSGWTTIGLKAGDSALAAAQLILVNLGNDRPENPQLLLQSGAQWVRSDSVGGEQVDVMTGPLAAGDTTSSLRYWIDGDGDVQRLEARLNGRDWSVFTLTGAPGVTF